jgi:hypothetical protein
LNFKFGLNFLFLKILITNLQVNCAFLLVLLLLKIRRTDMQYLQVSNVQIEKLRLTITATNSYSKKSSYEKYYWITAKNFFSISRYSQKMIVAIFLSKRYYTCYFNFYRKFHFSNFYLKVYKIHKTIFLENLALIFTLFLLFPCKKYIKNHNFVATTYLNRKLFPTR